MRTIRAWLLRIRGVFNKQRIDRDLAAELESHLQFHIDDNLRAGMSPKEARRAALIQLGGLDQTKESVRAQRGFLWLDSLFQDIRFALRMLRRNPGFTVVAVLTLALGIGANTAIFSVCNAILFKPLPYSNPNRVVMLWERLSTGKLVTVAPANYMDWRNENHSFSDVATVSTNSSFILGGQAEAARLSGGSVSANFFSTLGVQFALGRNFRADEDRPGQNHEVILAHSTWRERFGSDDQIVGKSIRLNDQSYAVIGVLPADFIYASSAEDFQARRQPDVWVPIALDAEKLRRGTHPLQVVARLKPGVSLAQAQTELDVIASDLARQYPEDDRDRGITAVPIAKQVTGSVRVALETLLGAVMLVLLIACANVASLLLSRTAARQREVAVRVAIGASLKRLAQQFLTESLLLATIGGAGGLLIALELISLMNAHLPADLSRAAGIHIDARMLLFTAAISEITGILFGMAPLFGVGRFSAGESLKQSDRVAGAGQAGLRNVLAAAQLAIAIILLVGAGLMARSFWALMHVEPGFRSDGVLTARLTLPKVSYPDNKSIAAFERGLLDRLRARPGVESAGLATYLPLSGNDNGWAFFVEGRPPLPTGVFDFAAYRPVSNGYFETLKIPLLQGRTFTPKDTADLPWVVVIDEAMAHQYWGSENPLGQRLRFNSNVWRTVIGVVGSVHHDGLEEETKPEMYVPVEEAANVESGPTLVLRTAANAGFTGDELRADVAAIDRSLPVDRVEMLDQSLSRSVAQPRFRTMIIGAFSLLALAMAAIGVYGVMNYLVIQRTREFGIRMSIGASQGDVLRLVLKRALLLIVAGACAGLAGSLALTRLIANLLFHTAPFDVGAFSMATILLALVAVAACWVPARRAMRVDPMVALRHE